MKAGDGRRLVWMLSESSVETWDDEDEQTVWTIPHSPALPAVARWLDDMPELLPPHLGRAIEQYIAHGVFARDMKTTEALRSLRALLAALTTEEPA